MTSKTAASRIRAAERAACIMELRRAGATYATIATEVGVTASRAHQVVMSLLRAAQVTAAEDASLMLALELDRLDALYAAVWAAAIEGDGPAIDRVLRVMDRRAKLLGLDWTARKSRDAREGSESRSGVILLPAELSIEEWLARYSPGHNQSSSIGEGDQ